MTESTSDWIEKNFPALREFATELLQLSDEIVHACFRLDEINDHLGVMIISFTQGQIDHFKSICVLVDSEQYPDAEIISRACIEGLYILLWSAWGPKDNPGKIRPLHWRVHEYFKEYDQMIKCNVNEIDFETETKIFNQIPINSHKFLTKEAIDSIRQGKALPEAPFNSRWPAKNNRDIILELIELDLIDQLPHYQVFYEGQSQWLHWTPRGFRKMLSYDKETGIFHNKDNCLRIGVGSIMIGFQCLFRTLLLFESHFGAGFLDRLSDLVHHNINFAN